MRLFRKYGDPLAWSVVGACAIIYLVSAAFSMLAVPTGEPWKFLFEPAHETLVDMGMGGSLPLHQLNIWSLITSTYMHVDIWHIVLNALCLIAFFPIVTQQYGAAKCFVIYTAACIAGALMSAVSGEIYSLGASGGVLGLYGAMIAYGIRGDHPARWAPVRAELLWVLANFAYGLTVSENISNAAHFGGLVGGLAAGLVIGPAKGAAIYFFRSKAALGCMALVGVFLAVNLSQGAWATYLAAEDRPAYDARMAARRAAELDETITQSNDTTALLARANQSYARKDWEAALRDLDAAIVIDPSPEALYYKAASLNMLSRFDEALKVYDTLVERDEHSIPVRYYRAVTQRQLGNSMAAETDYREIITLEPANADEYQMRATAFRMLGKLDEALEDYNRSIERDGSVAGVYLDRGSLLASRAQYEMAIADYDKVLALEPGLGSALSLKADALTNMSQYQRAIETYALAINSGVNEASVWNGRAWSYYQLGRQAEALADVEKSLALSPDYSAALDTRGHILEAMGQRDKAIVDYRAALAKDPSNTSSIEGLARLRAD